MTVLGGAFNSFEEAYKALEELIKSGKAIEKLKQLVKIQGGNPDVIDNPDLLPKAKYHIEVKANNNGYVASIDAEEIGIAAMLLGAGRKTKEDIIDYSAGITMVKKVGDKISEGETLCILHSNLTESKEAQTVAINAFVVSENAPEPISYIYDIIQ
jgi:pyrimidine-nucleoside phosphorylase/thymidine phosphorylase